MVVVEGEREDGKNSIEEKQLVLGKQEEGAAENNQLVI
jgi:hypothetical protein